jgi:NADH:ubiquinone oxidoreductase subunit K
MSATDTVPATPAVVQDGGRELGAPFTRYELSGGRLFVSDVETGASDVRIAFKLADSAYEGLLARMFGIPQTQQSLLVKLILTGAVVSVIGGYVARLPRIHLSRADTAMGLGVIHTALRDIGGAPCAAMPSAGVVIGIALLRRWVRSALTESVHDVEVLAHDAEVLAHKAEVRYSHHPAGPVAAARTT